jgi:hypothetical protein
MTRTVAELVIQNEAERPRPWAISRRFWAISERDFLKIHKNSANSCLTRSRLNFCLEIRAGETAWTLEYRNIFAPRRKEEKKMKALGQRIPSLIHFPFAPSEFTEMTFSFMQSNYSVIRITNLINQNILQHIWR